MMAKRTQTQAASPGHTGNRWCTRGSRRRLSGKACRHPCWLQRSWWSSSRRGKRYTGWNPKEEHKSQRRTPGKRLLWRRRSQAGTADKPAKRTTTTKTNRGRTPNTRTLLAASCRSRARSRRMLWPYPARRNMSPRGRTDTP